MTTVSVGMGAEIAGLQSGDIIMAANGVSGTGLVSVLQDRTQDFVQLDIQPAWSTETRTLMVQRGAGVEAKSPRVPSILKMAASGDLNAAERLWRDGDGDVDTKNIQTALRLVARNYPQQYVTWLDVLQENVPINIVVLEALMHGYNATHQPEKTIAVYDRWVADVGWDVWLQDQSLNTHGNLNIEKALLTALWKTNQQQRAIAHVREIQRWHADTGLESIVGMAPSTESRAVWSDKKAKYADVTGVDAAGHPWAIDDQPWTVLAFWATWCAPCKKELPELSEWAQKRTDVKVLAVNVDDNLDDKGVLKALEKFDVTSLVGLRSPELVSMVELQAIPTVVLIDSSGVERYRMLGYAPTTVAEMEARMVDVTPRVQLGVTSGVTVEWFAKPSVIDAHFDGRDFWVLDGQQISQVRNISSWLNGQDASMSQLRLEGVSENERPERLIKTMEQTGAVYNNGRVIRFQTERGGELLSLGEPLVDWAYINEELWLWTKNDIRSVTSTTQKLEQELQQQFQYDDKVNSNLDMGDFDLTLPTNHFRSLSGESKLNGEQAVLMIDDIDRKLDWDETELHADRIYFTTEKKKHDSKHAVKTTGLLGNKVLSVVRTGEYTWVLRQHTDVNKSMYSILVLDAEWHPVGGVSNLIERPRLVTENGSLKPLQNGGQQNDGRELWAVIPNRGMMHIELDAVQESED